MNDKRCVCGHQAEGHRGEVYECESRYGCVCVEFTSPGNRDRILWEHGRDSVDEIVCHNVDIHMEVMGDDHIWMGVSRDGRYLMVNIYRKGKTILYNVEADGPEWPWHRDEEHPA